MGRYTNEATLQKQQQAEQMLESGCSRGQIVRDLSVSLTTLRKWFGNSETLTRHGPEMKARAKAMRDDGVPYLRISRSLGMSVSTLTRWFGESPIERGLANANAERSRIARERYEECVKLRMQEGLPNREIAERVGLSLERVWSMLGATPERLGGIRRHDPGLRYRARYLRSCDYSIREISEEMGINRQTIHDWVRDTECGR